MRKVLMADVEHIAEADPVLDEFKAAARAFKTAQDAAVAARERYQAALDALNKKVCEAP